MENHKDLSTVEKALEINLDHSRYGTFAEIGAGQEVVRWFFQAGGANGTIAKSISAYDMVVSDSIYGKCKRYVDQERLQSMLDYECDITVDRLNGERGHSTCFFAFANTVSARNYAGTNRCHGSLSLHILKLIRANEAGWEELVPEKVAEVIKRKKLFR